MPLRRGRASRPTSTQVSLSATGYYRTPGIAYDRAKGRGKPFHYFACGAAVSEVEVDGYTGMKRVLRVDILHDVGDSLNPGVDRGQIEGGFVQGMGWLTSEELKWDEQGPAAHALGEHLPDPGDRRRAAGVPRRRCSTNAAQHGTIHGSKAVGEPPLMLAISVREAIRDAVAAFGAGGEVPLAVPATHEAIFMAVARRRGRAGGVAGGGVASRPPCYRKTLYETVQMPIPTVPRLMS